jgi:hypothetical protein
MYLDGSGVDRNFPEGVKWIEQASTDRYDLPKYVLTFIFAEGFGTPPDVQEAAARLSGVRKERTEAGASYFIATFYHRGFRVDKEDRRSSLGCSARVLAMIGPPILRPPACGLWLSMG